MQVVFAGAERVAVAVVAGAKPAADKPKFVAPKKKVKKLKSYENSRVVPIEFNRQLMAAKSAEGVLDVFKKGAFEFDAINVATALHRLGTLAPSFRTSYQKHALPRTLQKLERRTLESQCSVVPLANAPSTTMTVPRSCLHRGRRTRPIAGERRVAQES
ncbi:hypothetical protein M885DRAFT_499706 [Pelagophyceae sp. CCMP2097]|nr:hypothetical protein M885DRAFT_499706 [Pelagophyceae sp. CCMP2097]